MPSLKKRFPSRTSAMSEMVRLVEKLLPHNVSILLVGETGSGKDFLAHAIHECGPRAGQPFLTIDCGSLPEELFESELFGYEKGAFTDAKDRKAGKLEQAQGGTLYLDDIASLDPRLQPKLLRVLQERQFYRLGSTKPIDLDVRIISSSNVPPAALILRGQLREDLLYRLNVVTVSVPPLRERKKDIPILTRAFLLRAGANAKDISEEAMSLLSKHEWPGNIRQLENAVARAVLLSGGKVITPDHFPRELLPTAEVTLSRAVEERWSLDQLESQYIEQILREADGNFTRASRILGINRKTLLEKRRRYGIA